MPGKKGISHPPTRKAERGLLTTPRDVSTSAQLSVVPVYEICAAAGQPEYPVSSTPKSVLRKNFIDSAKEITEHAEKTNTYVAIEAINRFEGHAGFLNAVDEALPIAEEIGSDHIGVLADLFHVNMEDGPIPEIFRRAGKKLLHIHLADSNRQMPGTGHIDFLEMVRTLDDMGFAGLYVRRFRASEAGLENPR